MGQAARGRQGPSRSRYLLIRPNAHSSARLSNVPARNRRDAGLGNQHQHKPWRVVACIACAAWLPASCKPAQRGRSFSPRLGSEQLRGQRAGLTGTCPAGLSAASACLLASSFPLKPADCSHSAQCGARGFALTPDQDASSGMRCKLRFTPQYPLSPLELPAAEPRQSACRAISSVPSESPNTPCSQLAANLTTFHSPRTILQSFLVEHGRLAGCQGLSQAGRAALALRHPGPRPPPGGGSQLLGRCLPTRPGKHTTLSPIRQQQGRRPGYPASYPGRPAPAGPRTTPAARSRTNADSLRLWRQRPRVPSQPALLPGGGCKGARDAGGLPRWHLLLLLHSGACCKEAVRIALCSRSRPCPHCILGCSQDGDGCDYLIVLQQGEDVAPPGPLPTLPENARFVRHANECYDWGTWGWALHSHVPDLSAYQYFIFLNPSVRTLSRCTHRLLRSVCPGHQPKTHPRLMPPAAAVALHQAWCPGSSAPLSVVAAPASPCRCVAHSCPPTCEAACTGQSRCCPS